MHAWIEPSQGSAAAKTALGIFYCAIERTEMHACKVNKTLHAIITLL
jgi:hypothetical protein